MKLIVIHSQDSKSPPLVYNLAIKTAYFISDIVVSMGVDEILYFLKENIADCDIKQKIRFLKSWMKSGEEDIDSLLEFERVTKNYNQTKNKSSKMIISYNLLKKSLDKLFKAHLEDICTKVNMYGINEMKYLVNSNDFYFYSPTLTNTVFKGGNTHSKEEVLQLLLPDKEAGGPALFFMTLENMEDGNSYVIDFLESSHPAAGNLETIYGEEALILPNLLQLTSAEAYTIKQDLKDPTGAVRAKIDEWASVCYANPNSDKGLRFFKKELKPMLKSLSETVLQNPIIKNRAIFLNHQMQSRLMIGEAPIEKIWDIHFKLNNISQEEYDNLLKIKAEQHPKYEGRWPVFFYTILDEAADNTGNEREVEELAEAIVSVRKTLSID